MCYISEENSIRWKIEAIFEYIMFSILAKNIDVFMPVSDELGDELDSSRNIKRHVLGLAASADTFSPTIENTSRKRLNHNGTVKFCYVGSLDHKRKMLEIVGIFSELMGEGLDIGLTIAGNGDQLEAIREYTENMTFNDRFYILGFVPYNNIPAIIEKSDVCICIIPPTKMYVHSSPTKLFEYLSMQKPVIANSEIFESKRVLEKSGAGVLVEFTKDSIKKGIMTAVQEIDRLRNAGIEGRKWVIEHRSYDLSTNDIDTMLKNLTLLQE